MYQKNIRPAKLGDSINTPATSEPTSIRLRLILLVVLVHGIANNYGQELSGDSIFDAVLRRFYDKGGYYRVKQAIKEMEYTQEEMIKATFAAHHMGLWDK